MATPHPLRILAPFALGYFFSYALRTVNGAIAPALIHEYGISESALGMMTAAYFLTFALTQIPIGLAMDRFGPSRVNGSLLIVAVAGCALFAAGHEPWAMVTARGMLGLGMAGCLMTAIKANAQWFPMHRLPLVNSWVHVCGLLGAVVSTAPAAWLVAHHGVAGVFSVAGVIGAIAVVMLFTLVPQHPEQHQRVSMRESFAGVLRLFADRRFLQIAPVAAIAMGAHMAMQGLWIGQWLRQTRHVDDMAVAHDLFWMMMAGVVGSLSWGQLGTRLTRAGMPLLHVYACACSLHVLTLILMATGAPLPGWLLMAAFSFTGMGGSLCYALVTSRFPVEMAGRANTSLNLLIFVVAFVVQGGFGYALAQLQLHGTSMQQAWAVVLLGLAGSIAVGLGWALRKRKYDAK
ncbi:MFS transporter [Burkholderiaceae bacterium DAT-1]|nr:MFS transporter [Burkholderiaceae bacterium DAT-1]